MTRVMIDESMCSKLAGVHEEAELVDSAGQVVGHFVPAGEFTPPFTEDEMERRRQEPGGRPLVEIWKSLGRP